MTSVNGQTWYQSGAGPFAAPGTVLAQAAAGPSGYVVVGSAVRAGRRVAAAWSATGLHGWTWSGGAIAGDLGGPGTPQRMLAVAAARSGFVAVGADGAAPAVWTSPDGRTWRGTRLPVPRGAVGAVLTRVTAVSGRLVAVGTGSGRDASVPFAAVSADGGRTWREAALPSRGGRAGVTALSAVPGGVVAAGYEGAPGHQRVLVWWSLGGLAWHPVGPAGRWPPGPRVQRMTALGMSGPLLTGAGYTATAGGSRYAVFWHARVR